MTKQTDPIRQLLDHYEFDDETYGSLYVDIEALIEGAKDDQEDSEKEVI